MSSNLHRKTLLVTIRKVCKPHDDDCDDHDHDDDDETHSLSPLKILLICTLAATFAFLCYIIITKTCRAFQTRLRRRRLRNPNETHQDFIDADREPVVFHPIWLINTTGLDQAVIDSILMFKYTKEDGGLIQSDDCPVCLGMFQDQESLRLLPKCSHAFHVDCIDTWLRSHKNCPVCRAPVVNNASIHQIDQIESRTQEEEVPLGVPHNQTTVVENTREIDTNGEEKDSCTNGVRVQSDLTSHCCQKLEPMTRSVSMGSFRFVDQELVAECGAEKGHPELEYSRGTESSRSVDRVLDDENSPFKTSIRNSTVNRFRSI